MNAQLLSRSLGLIGPQGLQQPETLRQLYALVPAPYQFNGSTISAAASQARKGGTEALLPLAHRSGVNSLTIDPFEGRL